MLYWRIVTAICLIPLVISGVLLLPTIYFALAIAALVAAAALEWSALCRLSSPIAKVCYLGACLITLAFCSLFIILWVLILATLFWLLAWRWVVTYPTQTPKILSSPFMQAALGVFCLSSCGSALITLHHLNNGPLYIILLLLLVWSSDTIAYFVGKKWGQALLIPTVSPKKTWAGFIGGIFGPLAIAVMSFVVFQFPSLIPYKPKLLTAGNLPLWLSLSYLISLLSIVGDLFESLLKRLSGVKDSGKLLPGHGGLLDRIDSLIAAAPFFTLVILWARV